MPSQPDKLPLVLLRIRVRIRTCIFPSPTLPHSQVLARRVRKLGDALRRAVLTEVDQLAGGGVQPPADLESWDSLAAGEGPGMWVVWWPSKRVA